MKLMQYEHISRKYHLLWSQIQKAIIIKIHRDCIRSAKPVLISSPWFKVVSKQHDVDGLMDSFSGDLSSDSFGFSSEGRASIQKLREIGDYVDFLVPIPQIKKELNFVCEECGGSGKREEFDDTCRHCVGSGKRHIYDWKTGYLTTSSLGLLFDILDGCDETSAREHQHVTLYMLAQHGQHGSSLGGCFGIDFSNYLLSDSFELQSIILKNTLEAMQTAYGQLMILRDYDRCRIRGDVREGFLTLDCPGDGCGIYSSGHNSTQRQGHELSCHNVDNPAQSLTLLTGIASMVGQADFYISGKKKSTVTD
ncbi:MAG: hypothetical protein Q7R72_03150 [bacterium]|nr:hypothetical protein [bacterium]